MLQRPLLATFLSVLAGPLAFTQGGAILWSDAHGSPDTDYGVASHVAADDTIWTAGNVQGFGFGSKTAVRRYSRSGALLSSERFSLASWTTQKNDMVLGTSGGAYIGGWTRASSNSPMNMIVARVDEVGRLLWTRTIDSPRWDRIQGLAPDGQGGVFVGGWYGALGASSTGVEDAYVARYDELGVQVWSRVFGTSSYDSVEACASDGAGGLYAAGASRGAFTTSASGLKSGFLIRFDPDGGEIWRRSITSSGTDSVFELVSDRRGGCFVGGRTTGDYAQPLVGTTDAILTHFNAAGQELWRAQFDHDGELTLLNALAAHPDGGCVVALGAPSSNVGPALGSDDIRILRFDDSGQLVAEGQVGTPVTSEQAAHISFDRSGDMLLTGTASSDFFGTALGQRDAFIARLAADSIGGTICGTQPPNSIGLTAQLRIYGSGFVDDDTVDLRARNLPANTFGHFFTSPRPATPVTPPNSAGRLCIGGAIGRFVGPGQIMNSGSGGAIELRIQPSLMPSPTGMLSASSGQTWFFQAWYRDLLPMATSHMSTCGFLTFR